MTARRQIICTVGTSLLTNAGRPWGPWRASDGVPLPDEGQVRRWLADADASSASAETNTLRALEISADDSLCLLYSATEEGRFCAERVREHYEGVVLQVKADEIKQLGYGARAFTAGLKGLVDRTYDLIKEGRIAGLEPLLCTTGGFKAEMALLTLLGALEGIEVVYLHELHRELVSIPHLPIDWNLDLIDANIEFFEWIEAEFRRKEKVERRLATSPELLTLIEFGDDGHANLTGIGSMLFRATQERRAKAGRVCWPPDDPKSAAEKNILSKVPHHRPPGWERVVDRVCELAFVSLVRYGDAANIAQVVTILDGNKGMLGVRIGQGKAALPLLVETTARSQAQSELVAAKVRKCVE